LNKNSKTYLALKMDLNSKEFLEFGLIQRLTMMIRDQMTCLTSQTLHPFPLKEILFRDLGVRRILRRKNQYMAL
jgi:hypothetical protein